MNLHGVHLFQNMRIAQPSAKPSSNVQSLPPLKRTPAAAAAAGGSAVSGNPSFHFSPVESAVHRPLSADSLIDNTTANSSSNPSHGAAADARAARQSRSRRKSRKKSCGNADDDSLAGDKRSASCKRPKSTTGMARDPLDPTLANSTYSYLTQWVTLNFGAVWKLGIFCGSTLIHVLIINPKSALACLTAGK